MSISPTVKVISSAHISEKAFSAQGLIFKFCNTLAAFALASLPVFAGAKGDVGRLTYLSLSSTTDPFALDTELSRDNRWILWHETIRTTDPLAQVTWNLKIATVNTSNQINLTCDQTVILENGTLASCVSGVYDLGPVTQLHDRATTADAVLSVQGGFGQDNGRLLLTFGREGRGLSIGSYNAKTKTWAIAQTYAQSATNEVRYLMWPSDNTNQQKLIFRYFADVDGITQLFLSVGGQIQQLTNIPASSTFDLVTAPAYPRFIPGQDKLLVVADWEGTLQTRLYDYNGNYTILPLPASETLPIVTSTGEILYVVASCDDGRTGVNTDLQCYTLYRVNDNQREVLQRFDMGKLDPNYPYVFTVETFTKSGQNFISFLSQATPTTGIAYNNPAHIWVAEAKAGGRIWPISLTPNSPDNSPYIDPEWACNGSCLNVPSIYGHLYNLSTGL